MKRAPTLACSALLLAAAAPALAHHSFAMFDRSKTVVIDGTVKEMAWTNPHTWIDVEVPGSGGLPQEWKIEGPSPNILLRMGWKLGDINPGDRILLTFNPMKDGRDGGVIVSVKLRNGKVLSGIPRDPVNKPPKIPIASK